MNSLSLAALAAFCILMLPSVEAAKAGQSSHELQEPRIITPAAARTQTVFTAGALKILTPWARATPSGAQVGGAYFAIENTGDAADRLVGITSDISRSADIHESKLENGVMKMMPVPAGLEIKPGAKVELKPGGYHLMLTGLKAPLKQGQTFKATLTFEHAGAVPVDIKIEGVGSMTGEESMSGHRM